MIQPSIIHYWSMQVGTSAAEGRMQGTDQVRYKADMVGREMNMHGEVAERLMLVCQAPTAEKIFGGIITRYVMYGVSCLLVALTKKNPHSCIYPWRPELGPRRCPKFFQRNVFSLTLFRKMMAALCE